MAVPRVQAAVVASEIGGPEVMLYKTDVPIPEPKSGEVLIKNTVSSINYVDTYFRTGFYPSTKPEILGREGAGVVVALGRDTDQYDIHVGDHVLWLGTSGYAQYTAIPALKTLKLPDTVSEEIAASCGLAGLTALTLVEESYTIKANDWVMLHAAAGGVGILLTQILKDVGAKIIATAGGPEKVSLVKALGADHVIDYRSEEGKDWPMLVKEITSGSGVDVVYDSVGKDTWEGSLDVVKRKGTVVWYGNASGPVPPLTLHRLALKCIKIVRPTLFGYLETREEFDYYGSRLLGYLTSGKLKSRIQKVYPLSEVQQAHIDVESRKTIGKLLLKP